MGKIFISYRRDDSAATAGRLYDRLVAHFGARMVFKDVDSIPPGAQFMRYVQDVMAECSVVVALIGPHWLDAYGADGQRRLDAPDDFVRQEIELALRLNRTLIPVLVEGATMPAAALLPESLRSLPLINALPLRRDPDFDRDTRKLLLTLERWTPPLASAVRLTRASARPSLMATAINSVIIGALWGGVWFGALLGLLETFLAHFRAAPTGADAAQADLLASLSALLLYTVLLIFPALAGFLTASSTGARRYGILAAALANLIAVGVHNLIFTLLIGRRIVTLPVTGIPQSALQTVGLSSVDAIDMLVGVVIALLIGALGAQMGKRRYRPRQPDIWPRTVAA